MRNALAWLRVQGTAHGRELLLALAWLVLLVVAHYTSREPELFAGSLVLCAFLGVARMLSGWHEAARELERATAAEIALAIQPPSRVSEPVRREIMEMQRRTALAIRGQHAHLSEVSRG